MNILLLNWRDPKNPKSGGAEKLNIQILKPLIDRGDSVTWYATAVDKLPAVEQYKGITIRRFGSPLTHLLFWPLFYYSGKFGKPDLIIDCIHGTGYMSSIFAPNKKKVVLICEVAQNIWDEMYTFPINMIGKVWEKIMFRFYTKEKFWTISESTKKDLVTFGVNIQNIEIIPMGFDAVKLNKLPEKYDNPTALFVGRLAEMKGVKDAINAIAEVNKAATKKWNLHIIGRGEKIYERELRDLVAKLQLNDSVQFFGFVNEIDKFKEMAKAWVLLVPSSREGWGMIVPEANSVGTAVIGYNAPGLRDVAKKYSKENILVSKNYLKLYNLLASMKNPIKLSYKPHPGWDQLNSFVLRKIK
jgi:glycosyltransferase involved in cell wall biosynthesis